MEEHNETVEGIENDLTITPADLYKVEFKSTLIGGYDKMDVDKYLEKVAAVFEDLLRRVNEINEKLQWKAKELDEARTRENSVRDALASAQKFSDELMESTRRQADTLISEAKLLKEEALSESELMKSEAASEANLIRAQAEHDAERLTEALRDELDGLTKERNRLREDMNATLTMHRALLGDIPRAEDTFVDDEEEIDTEAIQLMSPFNDVDEPQED